VIIRPWDSIPNPAKENFSLWNLFLKDLYIKMEKYYIKFFVKLS